MDWKNVINPAVQQDITSAAQTASPALRERTPKAVRLPPVPAAALCTPAQAAIPAPAVRQREHAPDLTEDRLPPQAVQAAVLLQSDIPASTALKLNVCMKAAPPAPLTR